MKTNNNNIAVMTAAPKIYESRDRERLMLKFRALWIKSEKVLQIPAANRLGNEEGAGAIIVDEYAERIFKRFASFSWPQIAEAWDSTLIDLQREQAAGAFPLFHFGTLEQGLLGHLKQDAPPALPEAQPTPEEMAINELFENPTPAFVQEKAQQLLDHAANGLEFMLFGPHLNRIFETIETTIGHAAVMQAKKDSKTEEEYRKLLLEAWQGMQQPKQ